MNQNEIIAVAQTALALYTNGYQPGEEQFESAVDALVVGLSQSTGEEIERDTAMFMLVLAYYSMTCLGETLYTEIEEKVDEVDKVQASDEIGKRRLEIIQKPE